MHLQLSGQVEVTINKIEDVTNKLQVIFNDTTIESLKIIVPENEGVWVVYGQNNSRIDYSDPIVRYRIEVDKLPFIGSMTNLKNLDISGLGIRELPDGITELKKLKQLNLSRNRIRISAEIDKIKRLESLETLELFSVPIQEDEMQILEELGFDVRYKVETAKITGKVDNVEMLVPNSEAREIVRNVYSRGINELMDFMTKNFKLNDVEKRCVKLHHDLTQSFTGLTIFSDFDILRISNSIYIQLYDTTRNNIRERKTIIFSQSNITNHYTVYAQTDFYFLKYKIAGVKPVSSHIVYGPSNTMSEIESRVFKMINEFTPKIFTESEYINHLSVMSEKIKGIPTKDQLGINYEPSADEENRLFVYLFSPFLPSNIQILE